MTDSTRAVVHLGGSPVAAPNPVARWEYARVRAPSREEMAELGQEGWELVAIDAASMFHFKRPSPG